MHTTSSVNETLGAHIINIAFHMTTHQFQI